MFCVSFLMKSLFFTLSTWYCIRCLMNFFLFITLFSHALQFCAHLNCLPHFMNLSMLNIILNIFQMHCLLVFCKMTLHDSNELLFACRYTCSVLIWWNYFTWKRLCLYILRFNTCTGSWSFVRWPFTIHLNFSSLAGILV